MNTCKNLNVSKEFYSSIIKQLKEAIDTDKFDEVALKVFKEAIDSNYFDEVVLKNLLIFFEHEEFKNYLKNLENKNLIKMILKFL